MLGNRWVYAIDFVPSFLKMLFPGGGSLALAGCLYLSTGGREMAVLRRDTGEPPWLGRRLMGWCYDKLNVCAV